MRKEEIYDEVVAEIKPLLNELVQTEYMDPPNEETISGQYYVKEDVSVICDKLFEVTYELIKNEKN